MQVRQLKIEGAYEFTPQVFGDARGVFLSPYQEDVFTEAVGRPLYPVVQSSYSVSKRGVVRGIHFTAVPPGMGKYAYCSRGKAVDYIIDTRVGSPTFGMWDSVELDPQNCRSVHIPIGVGHLFVALEDDTTISYLLSTGYEPQREYAIHPLDPEIALPYPEDLDLVLSDRDRAAPTLAEAKELGILPDYAESLRLDARSAAVRSS
ncbi:dTDP-4-dehydrorhamnose 3,5-epimerase family protein [Streptomyces sp. ISL-100]|uniref:dTDP-4-dehydrorhamnose 3,5-epimerase family protein n=1 Tax=Streptomyces sp. ISL-100 TaxID=2819173 RepID=UPI001BEB67A9|nr:dTDP-4-dehydrorhamnose 3,5-epimerase family protein [Streptomyces sp. ISL-100]MBT2399308.1 dTDP-4-dehydrorhamnose 3,5-epimerase family protein [Streptomyces sp. ISL-100]